MQNVIASVLAGWYNVIESMINGEECHCGGYTSSTAFRTSCLAYALGHNTALTAVSRLPFTIVLPLRYL